MKLAEWRERAGLTQEAVAREIGVTTQAVSQWERNGRIPNPESAEMYDALVGAGGELYRLLGHVSREERAPEVLRLVRGLDVKIDDVAAVATVERAAQTEALRELTVELRALTTLVRDAIATRAAHNAQAASPPRRSSHGSSRSRA